MEVSALEIAGLITVKQDQVRMLSAAERRRDVPLTNDQAQQLLFGFVQGTGKKVKKADALKIHPRDPAFRTHLDKAQALALAYADTGGGAAGIGAAKSFALKHAINASDATVRLIEALLKAVPPAVRRDKGEVAAKFAEFRAWHAMLQPLFGIEPPDWTEKPLDQGILEFLARTGAGIDDEPENDLEETEEDAEDEDDDSESEE
jgi:putative DNA methylase